MTDQEKYLELIVSDEYQNDLTLERIDPVKAQALLDFINSKELSEKIEALKRYAELFGTDPVLCDKIQNL